MDDLCSVCGKGFRGLDPLFDSKGAAFHHKCVPKRNMKAMKAGIMKFFGEQGVEVVQIGRKVIRTDR